MKRAEPGQVRVHRGFMRADGSWELWPVDEIHNTSKSKFLGAKYRGEITD